MALQGVGFGVSGRVVISRGVITQRANEENLPAQTIERDYILANLSADIGDQNEPRLIFKGGTSLRMCHFETYRYSADLDFSTIDGLSVSGAMSLISLATDVCRRRIEASTLEISGVKNGQALISYVGPLGSRPKTIKIDIADDELVGSHDRLEILRRWSDLPPVAAIESYTLGEVAAEKLRCVVDRLQCRDLYDLHRLFDEKNIDPMETWYLYLRKSSNDVSRRRQRTRPQEWAMVFERRMVSYKERWDNELGDYLSNFPRFGDVERRLRRHLAPVIVTAQNLASTAG